MKLRTKYLTLAAVILFLSANGLVMAQKNEAKKLNRAVIRISTLTCSACFSTISAGLDTLNGYSGMGANLFRKLIAVDFSPPLTQEQISQKLTEVGYPGKIEYVDSIFENESFAYLESKRSGFSSAGGSCARGKGSGGGSCCPTPPASGSVPEKGTDL